MGWNHQPAKVGFGDDLPQRIVNEAWAQTVALANGWTIKREWRVDMWWHLTFDVIRVSKFWIWLWFMRQSSPLASTVFVWLTNITQHHTTQQNQHNSNHKPNNDGMDRAWSKEAADVCLALGSSITVTPASEMPTWMACKHLSWTLKTIRVGGEGSQS